MHRTTLVAVTTGRFVRSLVLFTVFYTIGSYFNEPEKPLYLAAVWGLLLGFLFCALSCMTQISVCLWRPTARPVDILPSWLDMRFIHAMTHIMSFRHAIHFSSAIHGDDTTCVCCGKPLKSGGGGLFLAQLALVGNSSSYGMTMAAIYVFVHMDCRNGPGFGYLKSACEETTQFYNGTSLSFEHFLLEDPFVRAIPTNKYERLDEGVRSIIRKAGDNSRYHTKLAAECIILCNKLKEDKSLGAAI